MHPKKPSYQPNKTDLTADELRKWTRLALMNLIAVPVYLLLLGGIAYAAWIMALRLVTVHELPAKLLLAFGIVIAVLAEAGVGYSAVRFTRRLLPHEGSADKTRQQK